MRMMKDVAKRMKKILDAEDRPKGRPVKQQVGFETRGYIQINLGMVCCKHCYIQGRHGSLIGYGS